MPNVIANPISMVNGDLVIEFIDTASPTATTYTYPSTQDFISVKNNGIAPITLTVGAITQAIDPGATYSAGVSLTSFIIKSSAATQAFYARAIKRTSNAAELSGSKVVLPVDVQFSAVKTVKVTLASGVNIDAAGQRRWAGGSAETTDWSGWKTQVWRIDNTHAFAVDIYLNMPDMGDYNDKTGAALKFTVPANKMNVLVTPADLPILGETIAEQVGLGFQAASGGAGGITVVSYAVPIV